MSFQQSLCRFGTTVCIVVVTSIQALPVAGATPGDGNISIVSPASHDARLPHFAKDPDGRLVMSWVEPHEQGHVLKYATLGEDRFSSPVEVTAGADWFVNWADFPSVVPIDDRLWAAHWLVRSGDSAYAYDVAVALSLDGGKTFSLPRTPHRDGTKTEHGFVSLFPARGGVGGLWLDGRAMSGDGHGAAHHGDGEGAMTLRSAVLVPEERIGVSSASHDWIPPRGSPADSDAGRVALRDEVVVDDRVCDCCQTDVARTTDGVVVVYRDRDAGEIRDIRAARFEAGRWHTPVTVADDGWKIAGCPVNGPAVAATGKTVVVGWFTAVGNSPEVRLARSMDGGHSFAAPTIVDGAKPTGRVDVALLDDGAAVVSWLCSKPRKGLCVRRIGAVGVAGPIRRVADTGASRAIGFPQLAVLSDRVMLAWAAGGTGGIRLAAIPVDALTASR